MTCYGGDQAVLPTTPSVAVRVLEAERHRPEPHEIPARITHVADVRLKPPGRRDGSELADAIDNHGDCVCYVSRDVSDACNTRPFLIVTDPNRI